jgi:hypothetical protein
LLAEFKKYCGNNPKDDYGTPVFGKANPKTIGSSLILIGTQCLT